MRVISLGKILFLQKNPLQDFPSSLNVVISTNESIEFITGHVIYKQVYTYKFQLKTTKLSLKLQNVWHSIHISWGEKPKNASFTCDDENNVSQSLKETTLRKSIR